MPNYAELKQAIIAADAAGVAALTQQALDEGTPPERILDEGLIPAMELVGEKFQSGEFFFPEMLVAARAMYAGLNLLRPLLAASNAAGKGKAVIGTVKGDMHDIGKNIVGAMFEGGGFQIVDLGINVKPEQFVEAVREHRPALVLMSALITTTMEAMAATIKALDEAGLRDSVKVGIGGAPVTQQFADEIGADFYANEASRAVAKAKRLLGIA